MFFLQLTADYKYHLNQNEYLCKLDLVCTVSKDNSNGSFNKRTTL